MYLADYLTQDVYWYKNSGIQGLGIPPCSPGGKGTWSKCSSGRRSRGPSRVVPWLRWRRSRAEVSGEDALENLDLAQQLVESGHRQAPIHRQLQVSNDTEIDRQER